MSKRTRSRERFPIGEWARKAKYKCIEAVEVSKSLGAGDFKYEGDRKNSKGEECSAAG